MGYGTDVVKESLSQVGKELAKASSSVVAVSVKKAPAVLTAITILALGYAGAIRYYEYVTAAPEHTAFVIAEGQAATQIANDQLGTLTDFFKVEKNGLEVKIQAEKGYEMVDEKGSPTDFIRAKIKPNSSAKVKISERKVGSDHVKTRDVVLRGWSTPISSFNPTAPWMNHMSLVKVDTKEKSDQPKGIVNYYDLPNQHKNFAMQLPLIPVTSTAVQADVIDRIEYKVATDHVFKAQLKAPLGTSFVLPDGQKAEVYNFGTIEHFGVISKEFDVQVNEGGEKRHITVAVIAVKAKKSAPIGRGEPEIPTSGTDAKKPKM